MNTSPESSWSIQIIGTRRFRTRVANAIAFLEADCEVNQSLENIGKVVQCPSFIARRIDYLRAWNRAIVFLDYESVRISRLALASFFLYLAKISSLRRPAISDRPTPQVGVATLTPRVQTELESLKLQIQLVERHVPDSYLRHCLVMNYQIIRHQMLDQALCDWTEALC